MKTVKIDSKELSNLLNNHLCKTHLSIRKDGSFTLMNHNERYQDDSELIRVELCIDVEVHNSYYDALQQEGDDDLFLEVVEDQIQNQLEQENFWNETDFEIEFV